MKMPEYEKIRNKRLGLFKREAPKGRWQHFRGGIWAFLNSSFGIWLLTVTFGSLAAVTYSNIQTCIRDAQAKAQEYKAVVDEIYFRGRFLFASVERATSVDDLRSRLKGVRQMHVQYKDMPMRFLQTTLSEIGGSIRSMRPKFEHMFNSMKKTPLEPGDISFLVVFTWGELPDDFLDVDLPVLKEAAKRLEAVRDVQLEFFDRWDVTPYCTLPSAFASLWQKRGPILEYRFRQEQVDWEIPFPNGVKLQGSDRR